MDWRATKSGAASDGRAAGAFGNESAVRADLVPIAQRKAAESRGFDPAAEVTVLIGDTERDVQAGLHGGARVIAVATGVSSVEQLTAAGAHAVLPDLEDIEAFGSGYDDHGLLFCKPDGRPIHPDTITRRFNRLVDAAGARRIRLHDVRHTYATLSLDAGINPKKVSDRIGHSNVGFTLATYGHPTTGDDAPAAQLFAELIFGPDDSRR